jgi:hypothetical protein
MSVSCAGAELLQEVLDEFPGKLGVIKTSLMSVDFEIS